MVGINTCFVGVLSQNKIEVPTLHCIVHREAFCAKSINLNGHYGCCGENYKFDKRMIQLSNPQEVPCNLKGSGFSIVRSSASCCGEIT